MTSVADFAVRDQGSHYNKPRSVLSSENRLVKLSVYFVIFALNDYTVLYYLNPLV